MSPRRLLLPVSWMFLGVVVLRRWLYATGWLRSVHLGPRTISVGNIEAGGTGKSPFVCGLAAALVQAGHRPVVLARGYKSGLSRGESACYLGSNLAGVRAVTRNPVICADEARMISAENPGVPVIIGADRVRAWMDFSQLINEYRPTHVILDDGFQHLRIERDVDVVLVSGDLRDEALLPAGNLREPVSALRRTDFVVQVTGRDGKSSGTRPAGPLARFAGASARIVYGRLYRVGAGPTDAEAGFRDLPRRPVLACAIARPAAFVRAVESTGVKPLRVVIAADHQRLPADQLTSTALHDADSIVTTLKDYWRDPEIIASSGLPVWVLPMTIEFPYQNLF